MKIQLYIYLIYQISIVSIYIFLANIVYTDMSISETNVNWETKFNPNQPELFWILKSVGGKRVLHHKSWTS